MTAVNTVLGRVEASALERSADVARKESPSYTVIVLPIGGIVRLTVAINSKIIDNSVNKRMPAMGQMASGVAHDFNNALSPILGSVELLLEAPGILDDREELTDPLQQIRTPALDAASVVRRLRGFYRGAQAEDDAEYVDVNEVIKSSINLTRPHWRVQA